MTYREHPAGRELARYVECYWALGDLPAGPGEPRRVVPDGCIDILFDLADPNGPKGRFIGTMTRTLITRPLARVDVFAIRFRPAGVRPFFGPRADEITDRTIALELEWRDGVELAERLALAPTAEARIAMIERVLLARLAATRRPIDPIAEASARAIIARGGNLEIAELAARAVISPRQLERKFAAEIGISPKKLARIVRVQRALALVPELGRGEWADAALDLGFSDQAHLIREMRAIAATTPTQSK